MSPKAPLPPSLRSDAASARLTAEDRWRALFGSEPPRSALLIEQALAWKEQVLAEGDVTSAVRRDLAIAAKAVRAGRSAGGAGPLAKGPVSPSPSGPSDIGGSPGVIAALPPASSQLLPGTRLVKSYAGTTHVVEVTVAGLLYAGELYGSLSAIAKVITGTHWNGLLFFGLRKRGTYPAKPAGKPKVAASGRVAVPSRRASAHG